MSQEIYTDYEIKEFAAIPSDIDNYMHDWIFHFNPYTKLWSAIPRDLYMKYWDDCNLKGILRSKDINTLLDLLHKAKGDIDQVYKMTTKIGK